MPSNAAKQIVLENVIIRQASVHNAEKRYAKIEFTASWTEEIREEMGWPDVPATYGALDLFGTLAISEAQYTPLAPVAKNGDMEKFREVFPAEDCTGFNLVPLKDKSGEVTGRELRFSISTNKLNVPGMVGRYVAKLGRAPGTLVLTLADNDRQTSFDTGE